MLYHPGYNDDPNRPFGYDSRRLATNDSPLGALIALAALFVLLFLVSFFFK